MSREELDEWLAWADAVRLKLRRATRELAELGEELFRAREQSDTGERDDDRSR